MADRPILFSAPMVRALLEGRKTQTRRVLKPRDYLDGAPLYPSYLNGACIGCCSHPEFFDLTAENDGVPAFAGPSPHLPGDRLYVRERAHIDAGTASYAADMPSDMDIKGLGYRPAIHMPRWASRLTLVVTDVRVQRVQEISEEDAKAEGVRRPYLPHWANEPYRSAFRGLWNDLNAARGFGWDDNPWVIAISFDVHHGNIDAMAAEAAE